MHRHVYRLEIKTEPTTTEKLQGLHFQQLYETRVWFTRHSRKVYDMSLRTAFSSDCLMISNIVHFVSMQWDESAPPRSRFYVAQQYSATSDHHSRQDLNKTYSIIYALRLLASRLGRRDCYSSATFASKSGNLQAKHWDVNSKTWAMSLWSICTVRVDTQLLCKLCAKFQGIATVYYLFKTTLVNARTYSTYYASRIPSIASPTFLLYHDFMST